MPDENKYRFAFLGIAVIVIIAAALFGKCSQSDESYKMAGVEPGDIVVKAHKYNPKVDPPPVTTKKRGPEGGERGQ